MIGLWFLKYALDKPIITKIRKGNNNSIVTCDRATVLAFTLSLIALYQCIKFHLIPFYTLRDKLIIAKIKMGINSVITCNSYSSCTLHYL